MWQCARITECRTRGIINKYGNGSVIESVCVVDSLIVYIQGIYDQIYGSNVVGITKRSYIY